MLKHVWISGKEGSLCGREQARAWALREVWQSEKESEHGLYSYIASKVRKTKGGKPSGPHPTCEGISKFFKRIDEDQDWHPGKFDNSNMGAPRVLKGHKLGAAVQAAQRIQRECGDVTFPVVVSAPPKALINPKTNNVIDKKAVYRMFEESCRDEGADDT